VTKRFASILENVDLPEDFGPHMRILGGLERLGAVNCASFLFHSPGDDNSFKKVFLGPSSDVKI
jgi:hypothetical protein